MNLKKVVQEQLKILKKELPTKELIEGIHLYNEEACTLLSQTGIEFNFYVGDDSEEGQLCDIEIEGKKLCFLMEGEDAQWNSLGYACLLAIKEELESLDPKAHEEHKKYSREGMMERVLAERKAKAAKAEYKIEWANNIYGDHILTNERGRKYRVFLRDFENETGYSDSDDARLNKLGTTKHIMYAFDKLKTNRKLFNKLSKEYPFIEIFCDPLNDYKVSWYFPYPLEQDEQQFVDRFFEGKSSIEHDELGKLLDFMEEAKRYERIHIRPEVNHRIEKLFDDQLLNLLKEKYAPDFSAINAELYPYQKKGIEFVLFRKAAIISDEMGLGKTIQAISAAILKKGIFGFRRSLVVCPASLKAQWKSEIEKFSNEKALVVEGPPDERAKLYQDNEAYFFMVNYETILRDSQVINNAGFDFLILDEAQRVKNFETKTASAVKRLNAKHTLVITGTPIENKLIDIFSIMGILDPEFFGPLWEFSYQHCLFDPNKKDKINGYYDLKKLNKKLSRIVLRRQKRQVIKELPNIIQKDIPVEMSALQQEYHGSYARGLSKIVRKKFLTPFDLKRMQLLLANMRMVCDSTYLVDQNTNESPKLVELEYMLMEKLDIVNNEIKLIIFSEWVKVHKLIGKILRKNKVGFVELSGKIPVKRRGDLIKKFEDDPKIKVFLSTEAGGAGLNLQVADTLINFELPWNPAKKNQRIGRIDRLGQKSKKLTVYNFITRLSIEERIAAGLVVKQNLFEGALDKASDMDFVDFSSKGRSQFIEQIEAMVDELEVTLPPEEQPVIEGVEEQQQEPEEDQLELDFSEEGMEEKDSESPDNTSEPSSSRRAEPRAQELEQVMNNGMQFLAGLFKMSTGKDFDVENQSVSVDRETGEVTMKFKLPKM
jgi:SNF2 family DNA or RNA helicase